MPNATQVSFLPTTFFNLYFFNKERNHYQYKEKIQINRKSLTKSTEILNKYISINV